jgi:hypothetical protein
MERASTEADAKERNQPIVVNLMVTASTPRSRHWFPPWNRRSPVLRGRGFSMPVSIAPNFDQNRTLKKKERRP